MNFICLILYSGLFPFFKHYYEYNIYVNIYISIKRTTFRHIVCCLHIYDTLVSLLTNTTWLYNVAVKYYHNIVYVTSKHFIIAINKSKGEFHIIIYYKGAVVFIVLSTAGSSCCSLLCFYHILITNNQILHFFSILSHCIVAVNDHKRKWVNVLTNKGTLFVYQVEYHWFNQLIHIIAIWP